MSRNPYWTDSNASLERGLESWKNPDASVSYQASGSTLYENFGYASGSYTQYEVIDFVTVNLRSDASYIFISSGTYQQDLSIFDSNGYLLNYTDGDDVGSYDAYPTDSIVSFRPDATGTYYLSVSNKTIRGSGTWSIGVSEDIGADFKNTATATATPVTTPVTTPTTTTTNLYATNGGGWLWGTSASETFWGAGGADVMVTGDGDNTVYSVGGSDVVVGGAGKDVIFGGDGGDWLYGGGGGDAISGDAGIDIAFGEAGNDSIYGGADTDYLLGGEGNDLINGDSGIDFLFGNEGDDTISGGTEQDALYGGVGNDSLSGDTGDDFLQGDAGNDTLTGGAGNDVFFFNGPGEGVDVITDMGAGDVLVLAGYGFTSVASVQAAMVQSGANVVLQTSGTSAITFLNKNVADFTANNFIV